LPLCGGWSVYEFCVYSFSRGQIAKTKVQRAKIKEQSLN
jgi:hypothetical protein